VDVNGSRIDITGNINKKLSGIREICQSYASQAEQYAKDNAGWTDRTGDARKLLKGYVIDGGGSLGFGVAHRKKHEKTGVIYGKYLEGWDKETETLTHEGKYPILKDAADHFKKAFFNQIKEALAGG
jgi:hypothetical protein